ncbi:DsbE family thiol:disulfide interchange protein [Erythrobacteraceae bacterium CFH 75059]|uniref:DsbE family thiol:disulfide interchange protein n=1 Tax=Qipengyuania thermophila TaxID=2509361 RepID=UPI0010224C8B|nr:DsbE family thiol:disulfide interchange protein [Qipengyuania thermophila]TCD05029.1 DsbE family thiol:disulfide interchange protein [Erythrobacteraceae bacterium CFH 75059]
MKRLWLFLPVAVFALIAGAVAYQLTQPRDEFVRSAMIGQPLPSFSLPPPGGGPATLSDASFRDGRPRLLNFWASWCLPCIAEAPQLERLRGEGAVIVGVAIRDRPEDVAAFLQTHGNPYAVLAADDIAELQLALGSSGLPETFVIDGQGRIRYQHIGDIRAADVPVLLDELRKAGS